MGVAGLSGDRLVTSHAGPSAASTDLNSTKSCPPSRLLSSSPPSSPNAMAAVGTAIAPADIPKTTENESPDQLADAVAGLAIQDDQRSPEQAQGTQQPEAQRPLRIYTRKQLLYLHASPLVQLPPGMPELKDWFG